MSKETSENAHPVDIHVGGMIRIRRKMLGISQEQLADTLGLTFQQVQKYERGANRVSASKLYLIGKTLSCPPGYFFDGLPDYDADEVATTDADELVRLFGTHGGRDLALAYRDLTSTQRISLLNIAQSIVQLSRNADHGDAGDVEPARLAA